MTLDPDTKTALRERLNFYRELGVGPLYRREVSGCAETLPENSDVAAIVVPEALDFDYSAGPASSSPDRATLLKVIADDIGPNCQRCKLAKLGRKQIVFGTGDPHAELMFVGEGPGADEDQQGLPFVGRAGQLLNNMIAAMGLKREQVYIANIVKCRPPWQSHARTRRMRNLLTFPDAADWGDSAQDYCGAGSDGSQEPVERERLDGVAARTSL